MSVDTTRYDRVQPDIFASPATDSGSVDQAMWPLGLSHNHLGLNGAGWARQQNIDVLPAALEMAGVDMRLSPHAYREMHWHQVGLSAFQYIDKLATYTTSIRLANGLIC